MPSVRCRLLLEVPTLVSIPAALADRLEDTNVVDDTPVRLALVYVYIVTHSSYQSQAESHVAPR